MVPICCLVALVSEWGLGGGGYFGVFATTVSAFTCTKGQTGATCLTGGRCSWFDSTFCLFILSTGEGLPPGEYSSLAGVNAADGALEIPFNSLSKVFKVLRYRGATAADLGPKIRLML